MNGDLNDDEKEFVRSLDLLSYKPVIYAANVSEDEAAADEENEYVKAVRGVCRRRRLGGRCYMREDRVGNIRTPG